MDAQFIFRREELGPRSIKGTHLMEYIILPTIESLGFESHHKKTYELGNNDKIIKELFFGPEGEIELDYIAAKSDDFIVNMYDLNEDVCKDLLKTFKKKSKGSYIDSLLGMGFGLDKNLNR